MCACSLRQLEGATNAFCRVRVWWYGHAGSSAAFQRDEERENGRRRQGARGGGGQGNRKPHFFFWRSKSRSGICESESFEPAGPVFFMDYQEIQYVRLSFVSCLPGTLSSQLTSKCLAFILTKKRKRIRCRPDPPERVGLALTSQATATSRHFCCPSTRVRGV